jgi:hypothetical protein
MYTPASDITTDDEENVSAYSGRPNFLKGHLWRAPRLPASFQLWGLEEEDEIRELVVAIRSLRLERGWWLGPAISAHRGMWLWFESR